MVRTFIGLGSNLGNQFEFLQAAVDGLQELGLNLRASRVVKSKPMYVLDQPDFLNAVVEMHTNLSPLELVKRAKNLETKIGRTPRQRNGPREIDIDLLLYGSISYQFNDQVFVPHLKMAERKFVLVPLADLDANLEIPGMGSLQNLLQLTNIDGQCVEYIENAALSIHR